jgi:copper homeostasis protein
MRKITTHHLNSYKTHSSSPHQTKSKNRSMLEVCVDNLESALTAVAGGAGRLELCSALSEGGLTPTLGFFKAVRKHAVAKVQLFVMIRCRRGNDFNFSSEEMELMLTDLQVFKENGADGFVFGALTDNEEIHADNCARVLRASGDLPVTFHRAFDLTPPHDYSKNCAQLADLGFNRLLTSGFHATAEAGLEYLKKMTDLPFQLKIMPGAGVTLANIERILKETGCQEIHASARRPKSLKKPETISMGGGAGDLEPLMVCDESIVKRMVEILNKIHN